MRPGYLLKATYATRTGRQGSRSCLIDQPTASAAIDVLYSRLERAGCSKIDIINHGKERS